MSDKTFEVERKELASILDRQHYTVDFYQREYGWGQSQMQDLLKDLYGSFSEDYDRLEAGLPTGPFAPVGFGSYFLGSYVISAEGSALNIIDGQQRLTSLSIIFLYLLENIPEGNNYSAPRYLEDLISSSKSGGKESYNIKTAQVEEAFGKIRKGQDIHNETGTIFARYQDVSDYLGERLSGDQKRYHYFLHWLRQRVLLVEVRTYSVVEAYTIFETMNDRGLPLTDYEMLKGFLLSHISTDRSEALKTWNRIIDRITVRFGKGEVSKFFTAVLRGRYGDWTLSRDFVRPNSVQWGETASYYRWFRENPGLIGLQQESDYVWLLKELDHLSKWRVEISNRVNTYHADTEHLWFIGKAETERSKQTALNYALPALFSVLHQHDEEVSREEELERLNIVGRFYDILRAQQMWSSSTTYPRGQDVNMVALFRGEETGKLALLCHQYLSAQAEPFASENVPAYKKGKNRTLTYLLLRIHDLFEQAEGRPRYVLSASKYDIEHMLAQHKDNLTEFNDEDEFNHYRNQIGALIILPKSRNASFRNMKYTDKVQRYVNDNVLAALTSPGMYDDAGVLLPNHPGLKTLGKTLDVTFVPQVTLGTEGIKSRNELYSAAASEVWNLEWFIERTGYSLEDLQEIFEEDEKVQDPYFTDVQTFVSKKFRKTTTESGRLQSLKRIYTYLGGDGAPLGVKYKQNGHEIPGIVLAEDGTLMYAGVSYEAVSPAIRALISPLKNSASGWKVLYLLDGEVGRDRSLLDLRSSLE